MKQFIVLMAMVALGLFMYACIAGEGDSILTSLKALWRFEAMTGPYAAGAGAGGAGACGAGACGAGACGAGAGGADAGGGPV